MMYLINATTITFHLQSTNVQLQGANSITTEHKYSYSAMC